jgi:hypothetical protein
MAAAGPRVGAADPRPDAFAVGVLRRDGFLIPVATFDGKRWRSNWPPPTQFGLEIPVSVSSVPNRWWGPTAPLEQWQAWTGAEPRAIRVQQPDWVDVHCFRQIVLRTDYRSALPPAPVTEQPYPKDGLAVSPPRELGRIEIVPLTSTETNELMPAVWNAFNRAERETAEGARHPVKTKSREMIQPEIEAVYAFGSAPRSYYVEANRAYRNTSLPSQVCALAFGTGWFRRDGSGAPKRLDMAVDLLQCDRYGATYMLPLGAIRIGERSFWIAQYSSWSHERFVVVEIKKDSVEAVISAFGGAC